MNAEAFDRIMRGYAFERGAISQEQAEEVLADAARVRDAVEQFCLQTNGKGATPQEITRLRRVLQGAPYAKEGRAEARHVKNYQLEDDDDG